MTPSWIPADGRLVVVGTDTDVGKTVVSALLVQGLGASYWKPVQCGELERGGDSGRVAGLIGLTRRLMPPCIVQEAYQLAAPASPNQAAEDEGIEVDPERLNLPDISGPLVVETAGGLLVPLRDDLMQIEQIKRWGLPVVLVARSGLGTLNHTLLSLEALKARSIKVLGLVLNGAPHHANKRTLETITKLPILAELTPLEELSASSLQEVWQNSPIGSD